MGGDEASCDEGGSRRGCCSHEEGDEGNEGHEGHEEEVRWRFLSCCAGSCGVRGLYLIAQVPRTPCTYSRWSSRSPRAYAGSIHHDAFHCISTLAPGSLVKFGR